jgi:hypothetical protein
MSTTKETLAELKIAIRSLMNTAMNTLMQGVLSKTRDVLNDAEEKQIRDFALVAEERVKGLAEVARERARGLVEVEARRAEFLSEMEAMHKHKEAHEGHVELNIGGYRYQTSVQALRRVPHTFFDAYFSGRYAQDVCDDGSIFVDRDGEHFGHVLEYMRDGFVSVAEPGACPSVTLLRALKREFGFYCIELVAERVTESKLPEMSFVMGGYGSGVVETLPSVEWFDAASGQWNAAAPMSTGRRLFSACAIADDIYVTGGMVEDGIRLSSVEKYSPASDTWSAVAPLPEARWGHSTVAIGSAMYVVGGNFDVNTNRRSILKFESTLGTWIELTRTPFAYDSFAVCVIGCDIYVFGGENAAGEMQSDVFKYDTVADSWDFLTPMPSRSSQHCASVLDGLVYILGVDEGHGVLRFDPLSNSFISLAPTSVKRKEGVSFVLGGCMYGAGGEGQSLSVERYNVSTDTWTAMVDMLEGRDCFATVTIGYEEQDLFDTLIAKASPPR